MGIDMESVKFIECGKIINTHGLDGAIKVYSWCDSPDVLAELSHFFILSDGAFVEKKIIRSSIFKQFVLLWVEGIDNVDTAAEYKNTVIYALRGEIALDEGAYFIVDLIGLPVIDEISGKVYGEITDILNYGASDVYVVKTEGGEKMFPAVDEFLKRIDIKTGVFITPIEGMFD
jgi:16S rRNA processing protein RimM